MMQIYKSLGFQAGMEGHTASKLYRFANESRLLFILCRSTHIKVNPPLSQIQPQGPLEGIRRETYRVQKATAINNAFCNGFLV